MTEPGRLSLELAKLCELIDRGLVVAGEVADFERSTWIVYGRAGYGGETIMAEFADRADAALVLRALPPAAESDLPVAVHLSGT